MSFWQFKYYLYYHNFSYFGGCGESIVHLWLLCFTSNETSMVAIVKALFIYIRARCLL